MDTSGRPAVSAMIVLALAAPAAAQQWPSFRGERASGVADGQNPPLTWDAEQGIGVVWRTAVPGLGHSSPVVWGDRLFVTTAVSPGRDPYLRPGLYGESPENREDWVHHYRVYCLDKHSGEILWERTAASGIPKVRRHVKSSHATPSPATDGRRVVVSFGSEGLYAFDMEGTPLWRADLGYLDSGAFDAPEIQWGYGSSPVIHGNRVVVLCDANNQAYIAAFDLETGQQLWRTRRDEVPTWGTPTVHETPERRQVIVNGFRHIGGYDLDTGRELWRMRGGGDIPVPTPVLAHGLVFFTNAHGPQSPLLSVRLDAEGDVSLAEGQTSNGAVAWSLPLRGAYLPTPIVYGDHLYVGNDRGVLTAYQARTGEELYRTRLAGSRGAFAASPVASDGRIYFTNEDCATHVVKAGAAYEHLGTNHVPGVCLATPAISEGMFFVRTSTHVWGLGRTEKRLVFASAPEAESAAQPAPATATAAAPPTPVGELTDAVAILRAADAAARAVRAATYDVVVEPTGAATGQYPALEARVASTGWIQGLPERFRVDAVVRPPGAAQPFRILGGSDGNRYYLVDHEAKVVHQDLEVQVIGRHRRAVLSSLVTELHHPEPFSQEIESPVREFLGIAEVEGEPCYQVRVVYDAEASYQATWSFSKKDLLPRRRADLFTLQEGQKGGRVITIRKLVANPDLAADAFVLVVPEGFSTKSQPAL